MARVVAWLTTPRALDTVDPSMPNPKRCAVVIAALLVGCARVHVAVAPAPTDLSERNPGKVICIVENPRVAVSQFLDSYRAALEGKGYTVKVVKKNPQTAACPLTTRYAAYTGGLAQIDLYWEGSPIGQATHTNAATSDEEIKQLVDRLLP